MQPGRERLPSSNMQLSDLQLRRMGSPVRGGMRGDLYDDVLREPVHAQLPAE